MQALGADKVAFTEGFGRYRLDYRRLQFSAVRSLSTSILAGKRLETPNGGLLGEPR